MLTGWAKGGGNSSSLGSSSSMGIDVEPSRCRRRKSAAGRRSSTTLWVPDFRRSTNFRDSDDAPAAAAAGTAVRVPANPSSFPFAVGLLTAPAPAPAPASVSDATPGAAKAIGGTAAATGGDRVAKGVAGKRKPCDVCSCSSQKHHDNSLDRADDVAGVFLPWASIC